MTSEIEEVSPGLSECDIISQSPILEEADKNITDRDFRCERILPNGWMLNTREELSYYRIFREHFGSDISLTWMGRTDNGTVA